MIVWQVLFKCAPEWVVYHEVVFTTKYFMREVTLIDPAWLTELAPHFYQSKGTIKKRMRDAPTSESAEPVDDDRETAVDGPESKYPRWL